MIYQQCRKWPLLQHVTHVTESTTPKADNKESIFECITSGRRRPKESESIHQLRTWRVNLFLPLLMLFGRSQYLSLNSGLQMCGYIAKNISNMFCATFFFHRICIEHTRNLFDADDTAKMGVIPFVNHSTRHGKVKEVQQS